MNILLNGPKGSFVIVDYVILVLAVFFNCIVLQGIIRAKFNLAGYRRFLISLVISELYVCAVNLALFMFEILTWYMPNSFGNHCESHVLRSFQLVGFFANLLNLLGLTVDHFIGIIYPLKYRSWMSASAARTAVCIIWVTSLIFGFADMPIATIKYFSQKSTSNSKPAVCSGNVISDIVDILESSDFLTANSQLLFKDSANNKNAAGSLNSFAFNRLANNASSPNSFASFNASNYDGAYANYINNPAMSDPALYPFLFLAQSESYYDDKLLRDARNAPVIKTRSKTDARVKAGHVTLSGLTMTTTTAAKQLLLPAATPPVSINQKVTTAMLLKSNKRIVQSPENEVALCEALIKAQNKMDDHGWCSQYGSDPWLEVCIMTLTVLCFIFFTFSYGKIFKKVFVESEFQRRKTRKMVVTTCLLLSTFAICYMPFMLYEFFMMWYDDAAQVQSSTTFLLIHNVFNSLLLSYPLFDPIIFIARSKPVFRNVVEQFSWLLPCCPSFIQARIHHARSNCSTSEISVGTTRNLSLRNSYHLHSSTLAGYDTKTGGESSPACSMSQNNDHEPLPYKTNAPLSSPYQQKIQHFMTLPASNRDVLSLEMNSLPSPRTPSSPYMDGCVTVTSHLLKNNSNETLNN